MAGAQETSWTFWGGDLTECQENGSKEPRESIKPFPRAGVRHTLKVVDAEGGGCLVNC